ncbi:alpha/beta hydrolase family protein (macronuclear) [Tetrahymena thermophila SB210]|uniref:Alpha/beta hydrolase family protein n=1 Tax=Tetrahymena thermophila (strain SB210) TaxID=312017 RepID=Q234E4_TETTS|nr:alpha/beta hydrolase family protein [Tetrahymena thermophila SB210]EAR92059.2 alpha/beta hydrolase family protein [Tetrahymena thermophila SB210]|eukprot:XP_001012304.2 alpha/beta hydrolase family protein [Tetrahymena thermophila SB210]
MVGKINEIITKYPKIFVTVVLLATLFCVWGIFYFFYSMLCIIFPAPISILIILYGIYRNLRMICRFIAFPGSFFLMKRSVENNYCKTFAKRGLMKVQKLLEIVECMLDSTEDIDMIYNQNTCSEICTIKQNLTGLSQTFNFMGETYNLDKDQRNIQVILSKIVTLFSQIKYEDRENDNRQYQLDNLLDNPMLLSKLIKSKSMISERQDLEELQRQLQKMEVIYLDLLEQKPIDKRIHRWMYNKTLGSLDQLRSDIEQQFDSKRLFLKSFDNKIIDCLIIYGDASNLQTEVTNKIKELPTLIYCNPNAGYYESLFYESDWIEYYISKGINLVVYNYRGYGCSEGTPTPQNLFKDCECLVDYLRQDLQAGQIGIHGQSIGGMVACYVANSKKLNFLLADRTFAQFSDIANYAYGSKVKSLFRMLVDWDFQMSSFFVKADCYKLISFDLKDEVIPYMASLKNGVSKDYVVLNNKLNTTPMIDFPKIPHSSRSSLPLKERLSLYAQDKKSQMKKAFEVDFRLNEISQDILSQNDTISLFNSLRRIMEVIKDVSQYRSSGGKRNPSSKSTCQTSKHRKTNSQIRRSNSDPQNIVDGEENQIEKTNSQNLNESINLDMTLNTSMIKQPYDDADQSMIYQGNHNDNQISPNESNQNSLEKTSILQKQNEFVSLEIQSTAASSVSSQSSTETNTKTDFQKSHLQYLNDDVRSDGAFQDFLIHCFSVMDQFDSAGLPLSGVFTNFRPDLQFNVFKQFFLNLGQWGSVKPQTYIIQKNLNIFGLKKYGLVKLKETIKKFRDMNQQHKTDGHYYFEKLINLDLSIICSKLSIIKEKLIRDLQSEQLKFKDDIEICLSGRGENDDKELNQGSSQYSFTNKDKQYENSAGYLLQLDCGHNGLYSSNELNYLEFHMKRSGFLQ